MKNLKNIIKDIPLPFIPMVLTAYGIVYLGFIDFCLSPFILIGAVICAIIKN